MARLGWHGAMGDDAMQTIEKADVRDYIVNGTFDVSASFKRDADSTESKTVTLRVNLMNVNLGDIIADALKPKRITWQNNVARKKFDLIADRSVVEIDYSSPGKREMSAEELVAKLANKTNDIDGLIAKLEALKNVNK
jgi:hypothetical protein